MVRAAWVALTCAVAGLALGFPAWADETAEPGAKSGAGETHWAFEPVRRPPVPAVKDREWPASEVDCFVLARLEAKGMAPARRADRRALIRRASIDLIGLPPTFEEVLAFESDPSPQAFERVVDRLLASPHYGERWARHWLDVARYADTKGYVFEEERRYPYAYTYRDYVIRAFNEDLPYDRFIIEQIAADHLELGADPRPLAAMGFLTLGRRFLNNQADIIDDRIDVATRGLMALTVTCARCHDHKYDPIPTRDYYSLYGVFASSIEPRDPPLVAQPVENEAYKAFRMDLEARQGEVDRFLKKKHAELEADFRTRVGDYLLAIARRQSEEKTLPDELPLMQIAQGDLNPLMLRRWKAYLEEKARANDPIFLPWHALMRTPEREFVEKASEITAGSEPSGRLNPLVAQALAEKPPASLRDLAERYRELLGETEKLWREALEAHSRITGEKGPPPAALPDPHREALRQVLYASDAPPSVPAGEIERFFDRSVRNQLRDLRKKVDQLKATHPGAPARAMSLADAPTLHNPRVFIRGSPQNPGEEVPRQFLSVLAGRDRKPFQKGSGRLELAQAIASKENPLTARVMVNRMWLHLFGAGLVRTPGDFGLRSDPPVHRELLDYLASRFMDDGWSVKRALRLIMLSSVYQESSDERPEYARLDPENRLHYRANRRRLDFEALRDSLLFVSGELDTALGGPSVEITTASFSRRRTLYGFIDRQNLQGMFRTFDFASPDTTCPQRYTTTVPQQALFLMNSPFVAEMARRLVARPEAQVVKDPVSVVGRLHRLVHGREAGPEEASLGLQYLMGGEWKEAGTLSSREKYAQALLLSNEFAFID